jgi:non-specific serine/threonine protein kinase
LRVLTGGAHDLPARQQTLRATIDWSYDLLTLEEQTLFAWLSVFVGGCTLEVAEDVCARAGDLLLDVLDGVTSLVDKSLLWREEDPTSGEPRFTMLETIREYAGERLAASGAEGTLRAAHAAHFLALVEEAEPQLTGAQQAMWLARLDREHDNLRAVLRWAEEHEEHREVGLQVAAALWRFWFVRGHYGEGRSWLEVFCTPAPSGAGQSSIATVAVRATALEGAGNLAEMHGEYARATLLHEESLALRRGLGDERGIAMSLNSLGNMFQEQGDSNPCPHLERALVVW